MTKSEIVSGPGGTTFAGPAAVGLVQAVAIRSGLHMYVTCGMKPNAAYTPKNMMRVAAHITGKTYRPRAYTQAIEDLTAWIEKRRADPGEVGMSIPRATVKQLHAVLDILIGVGHGDREVQVWLPGTYIAVDPVLITKSAHGVILIEGNVVAPVANLGSGVPGDCD